MVEVVAALIWRENRFLICQRPEGKKRAMLWEFVGGKLEKGESGAEALVRECREELGATICPNGVFADVVHTYPDITIHLTLFHAAFADGEEPKCLEHNDLRWITPQEIPNFAFCPADAPFLALIQEKYGCKPEI